MILLKTYWRELTILLLSIFAYSLYRKEPRIVESTKIEYVDRVVEKVVTVEKEVVKDKKKRTTVQKPDGTKVITETEESTKTSENKEKTVVDKEEKETQTETKIQTNHSYSLGIDVKLYPETEYSASFQMRLGDLPLLIGPTIYVQQTEYFSFGLGIGIQLEI
jgi:hypothetical protein